MKKTPRKKILAMSVFVASILLTSCSSSIKSESNQIKIGSDKKEINVIPASDEDIFLYRQIGISYLCMARQIDCLLYTSPSPRDATLSRMPSSA